jgi:hypothetical protein
MPLVYIGTENAVLVSVLDSGIINMVSLFRQDNLGITEL